MLRKLFIAFLTVMSVISILVFIPPSIILSQGEVILNNDMSDLEKHSAHINPVPAETTDAVFQIYGARVVSWRGAFGIHTWIAARKKNSQDYHVYHLDYPSNPQPNQQTFISSLARVPDFYWWGNKPFLIASITGEAASSAISRLDGLVADYPYKNVYDAVPGPNSNTFTAYVIKNTPEIQVALPPAAIGKDYPVFNQLWYETPSRQGHTLSWKGVIGLTISRYEGFYINILGLPLGMDFRRKTIVLPGLVGAWTSENGKNG